MLPRLLLRSFFVTVAVLAIGGAAAAKTVTVTITKNGYVPSSLTIAQGDTVQFTNGDSAAHQVSFKSTTGVTCTPNPLVIQPSASGTCTFASAGSYSYSDPNVHGKTFRGSITVSAPPESLTLTGKPVLLIFGGKVALSGALSTQKVGESIDVLGQQCGAASAAKLSTVPTATGGAFTSSTQPMMNTSYTAKLRSTTSPAVAVRVRPLMQLRKVATQKFSLRVSATQSFAGKYASFQRYNGTLHRWVAVKTVALKTGTGGVAPTVVSAATFKARVKTGLRLRATLSQAQAGTCYAPGLSNTARS
jgi:plastocyanin